MYTYTVSLWMLKSSLIIWEHFATKLIYYNHELLVAMQTVAVRRSMVKKLLCFFSFHIICMWSNLWWNFQVVLVKSYLKLVFCGILTMNVWVWCAHNHNKDGLFKTLARRHSVVLNVLSFLSGKYFRKQLHLFFIECLCGAGDHFILTAPLITR